KSITVQDITPPLISGQGADATIDCPASPVFIAPVATDACDPNPLVVEVSDVTTPGSCAGTYTRTKTWKAVDACGNQSGTVSQSIDRKNVMQANISGQGADGTIDCNASPVFTAPTATDACDPN